MTMRAAVLATFYVYKDPATAHRLAERFCATQPLEEDKDAPDVWFGETATSKTMLHLFTPPSHAAQDTSVVQLALDEQGDALQVWPRLRQQLDAIVNDEHDEHDEHDDPMLSPNLLGYTLCYYAMLPPACSGRTPAETEAEAERSCRRLLPAIARLCNAAPEFSPAPIVHAALEDGHLYLMATPVGDGLKAATIYLALAPGEPTDPATLLMRRGLFGRAAALLMPDLIAHKSYAEQRGMQRDTLAQQTPTTHPVISWRESYNQQVEALRSAVLSLLQKHPGGKTALDEADLEPLVRQYETLVARMVRLDAFTISLSQQYHHSAWWLNQAGGNSVLAYHHEALALAVKDIELLLDKGRHVLGVAGTTVEIARAQLEKRRMETEKQAEHARDYDRQMLGGLFTIISLALAIPQLVTWDVACGWLLRLGWVVHCENTLALRPFAVQIGLTVLVILIALPIVRWLLHRVERSGM